MSDRDEEWQKDEGQKNRQSFAKVRWPFFCHQIFLPYYFGDFFAANK